MNTTPLPFLAHLAPVRWRLRRGVGALGVPGGLGVGILVLSVMYGVSGLVPLGRELAELRRQAAPVKIEPDMPRMQPAQTLPQDFPARTELLKWLDRLHRAATENQFQIDLGSYVLDSGHPPLITYELNFPVKAEYAQLRGFLAHALSDNASLSLDQISFRRQKISDSQLDAQIRMTLFLRKE